MIDDPMQTMLLSYGTETTANKSECGLRHACNVAEFPSNASLSVSASLHLYLHLLLHLHPPSSLRLVCTLRECRAFCRANCGQSLPIYNAYAKRRFPTMDPALVRWKKLHRHQQWSPDSHLPNRVAFRHTPLLLLRGPHHSSQASTHLELQATPLSLALGMAVVCGLFLLLGNTYPSWEISLCSELWLWGRGGSFAFIYLVCASASTFPTSPLRLALYPMLST
ncbi:uncharacterized protein DMAD_05049 [Drosophila madeirensis]|uniref:Uncharacterized protein n=1 Tax=Drosophila madeirensis TaxID=30013 RepID=A0AAU9GEZ1_DROMD